ncbi:SMI1/KNR4 family protein [Streptomyces sp. NPDC046759]|uniref:SMI1/KNR4 family protein n=1 Tax=Streptomyces sp. NPDC046759 TaxID=3155019 RepID=UPI0033C76138
MSDETAVRQVTDAWARIEGWLRENAPVTHAALGPGASEGEIAAVEEGLGFAVPVELRTLWTLVSGGTVQGRGPWPEGDVLMRLDDVVSQYRLKRELQQELDDKAGTAAVLDDGSPRVWGKTWIPVFSSREYDSAYGTFLNAETGLLWRWDTFEYEPPRHDDVQHSIVTLLEEIADSLETPGLATEFRPGLLDGRLVWLGQRMNEDEQRRFQPLG